MAFLGIKIEYLSDEEIKELEHKEAIQLKGGQAAASRTVTT